MQRSVKHRKEIIKELGGWKKCEERKGTDMGKVKARKTAGWILLSEVTWNERNKDSEVGKLS